MSSIDRTMVVIGDSGVGKTCLLTLIGERRFPYGLHSQVIYAGHPKRMTIDGKHINMALWDPAGVFHAEMTNSGRQRLYPDSAVVVICFAIDNPDSLISVTEHWYPEVRHFCSAPILLVGCKADLRDPQWSSYEDDKVTKATTKWVTKSQGRLIAGNIRAVEYLECSAMRNQGVDQVMLSATRIAASWNPNGQSSGRSTCQII